MRISVFGLGYVGAVSAACLARDGHQVIGCDIDPIKLDLLRAGRSPIIEAGLPELIAQVTAAGTLLVTDDARQAVAESELSLICVGTPSDKTGAQDLTAVARLAGQLGQAIATKSERHGFVVRSTVAPGTTETVVAPTIAARSGKQPGVDFAVAFQPEFLREGASIQDYDHPPYTVVGTDDPAIEASLRTLYGHLPSPFIVTDIRSAEMLKMVANAFHALKITFANEVGRLGQSLNLDARRVMDLICQDRQLNISTAYLRPGFAFGGSCLPKDLRALGALARQQSVSVPMLQSVLTSNQMHVDHAADFVIESGRRRVGIFGLSFKSGTDDLRESPLVAIVERFIGKGLDVRVYDPNVHLARLMGANKRYIEESIPHIASVMSADIADVIRHAEVMVVGLPHADVHDAIRAHSTAEQVILDLVGVPNPETIQAQIHGICW